MENRLLMPGEHRSLYLDIWDYPGEWLIDLVLLDLSYEDFSSMMLSQVRKLSSIIPKSNTLLALKDRLDPCKAPDPRLLKESVEHYVQWLLECKRAGMSLIVPSRQVLPGNLLGAPIIEFMPWLWEAPSSYSKDSLYGVMKKRYDSYKKEIVENFYETMFSKLDRAEEEVSGRDGLERVYASYFGTEDEAILAKDGYHTVKSTYDEEKHLLSLLRSMVTSASHEIRGQSSNCQYMVLSSIAATKCLEVNYQGRNTQVLSTGREGENYFYPGSVPSQWSEQSMADFQKHFIMRQLPPPLMNPGDPIPNINMDVMLSYLLKDKL